MRRVIVAAAVICLASSASHAQERGRAGGFVRVDFPSGVVRGAPYSADVINETVQTLSDGNRIVRRSTAHVYRDNEGRLRREEDRGAGAPVIIITDPLARSAWTLDTVNRIARQNSLSPLLMNGVLGNDMQRLERVTALLNGVPTDFTVATNGRGLTLAGNEQSVEEHLTSRTVEGLRVEGTRRTTTIAAGAIGNERALVATTEEWSSPELKTLVLSEHSDPRTGTSTYKLVNVKRSEPAASLFQVPADYTVQVAGAGGRGARGVAPR